MNRSSSRMSVVRPSRRTVKLIILICFMAVFVYARETGAPTQRTGGFGELTCDTAGCHESFALNAGRILGGTFDIIGVPAQYTPGTVYPITVTIRQNRQSRWGFELATRFQSNAMQAGSIELTDTTNMQILPDNGIQYITHTFTGTQAGTVNGPVSWTFNWRAPAQASGVVVFNAAGNAADGRRDRLGDYIYTDVKISNPPGGQVFTNNTYFAQFANGSGVTSSLTLVNSSGIPITAAVNVFDDNGNPINLSMNAEPSNSPSNFVVPPLGAQLFTSNGQGTLTAGSVTVLSSAPLGGLLLFNAGLTTGVGSGTPVSAFVVPVTRNAATGLSTGIAISNTGNGAVTLNLTLHGLDGMPRATASIPLVANGHVARFIHEFTWSPSVTTDDFKGTLEVRSSGPVAATALRFGGGEFTTLPVVPLN